MNRVYHPSQVLRRCVQVVVLLFLCTPLMRLTYLDFRGGALVLLGLRIPAEQVFIVAIAGLLAFGIVFFLGSRFGRVLCAYACPVHLYLEGRKTGKYKALVWIAAVALPALLSESAISFVFSYQQQLDLYRTQSFPQPILAVQGLIFAVFIAVFVIYREKACRKACPYCILQNLARTDSVALVKFDTECGRCIECGACDRACPYSLDVRKECDDLDCSNCCRCSVACQKVLGTGKQVLDLQRFKSEEEE